MPSPTRRRTSCLVVLACLAVAALLGASGTASADLPAQAAASCSAPRYPGEGYFTERIRTRRVSCRTARSFVKAYYRCRLRHGKAGRCSSLRGYRCTERRVRIPTELNARATCRNGGRRIIHTYQQFL
jgi:hypothetical protein